MAQTLSLKKMNHFAVTAVSVTGARRFVGTYATKASIYQFADDITEGETYNGSTVIFEVSSINPATGATFGDPIRVQITD